jgi:type II secretory pathway pseudopilin PulG
MKKQSIQSGFSLVEMMVAIAIFMVVAVVAVAALLKIVDADRKSKTLQDTVNNINFAMDSITREIRVGSAYTCSNSFGGYTGPISKGSLGTLCPDGTESNRTTGTSIAFLSSNTGTNSSVSPSVSCNLTYAYYFKPIESADGTYTWTIEKAQQESNSPSLNQCGDSLGGSNTQYAPIIDPSIVITAYTIKVVEGNPLIQPSVFLYISGYTGKADKTKTYFDLQTTISERI